MLFTDERIYFGGRLSKSVPTKYGMRREMERRVFNAIYEDEELYARKVRASHNLNPHTKYELEIFDELPEGWRVEMYQHGRQGLRSGDRCQGKYLWCENGNPYLDRYPGDSTRNPEYRQALVRRVA